MDAPEETAELIGHRPRVVVSYVLALFVGVCFLIGSSPTMQDVLGPAGLTLWAALTVLGALLCILGAWASGPAGLIRWLKVERWGLWALFAAFVAYAVILIAAMPESDAPTVPLGVAFIVLMALWALVLRYLTVRLVLRLPKGPTS